MKEFAQISDIKMPDIMEYCREQGPEAVAWLKKTVHEKEPRRKEVREEYTDELGETKYRLKTIEDEQELSFVSIRSRFIDKFMPEIRKGDKNKKPTFRDLVDAM